MNHLFQLAVTAAPWALEGAPVLLRGDLAEQFRRARDIGYDAVELHLREPEEAPAQMVRRLSQETGVKVSAIATGLANLVDKLCFIDDDPDVRNAAVARIRAFIDWARITESGIIIGSLRGKIPDIHNRSACDARMRACIEQILVYNEPAPVPIYFEAINRYENNYLNTAEETLRFVNSFGSAHLFVHLDTFHMNIEEADMCAAIRLAGERLGYIHFADNTRHACGAGSLDFAAVLRALADIKYQGYVSIECLPIPDGEKAAAGSLDYLNKIINNL